MGGGGGGLDVLVRYLGRIKAIHLMKIILQKVHTLSGFSQTPPPISGLNPRVGRKSVLTPPLIWKWKIHCLISNCYKCLVHHGLF